MNNILIESSPNQFHILADTTTSANITLSQPHHTVVVILPNNNIITIDGLGTITHHNYESLVFTTQLELS